MYHHHQTTIKEESIGLAQHLEGVAELQHSSTSADKLAAARQAAFDDSEELAAGLQDVAHRAAVANAALPEVPGEDRRDAALEGCPDCLALGSQGCSSRDLTCTVLTQNKRDETISGLCTEDRQLG
ncbi:MAG: hypothetical protein FRX49_03352 [Trebouxia sp. A1-2]|nr:MAG: hypothetical protein FRX49_03352 [Trebouxia sp. A1-2]